VATAAARSADPGRGGVGKSRLLESLERATARSHLGGDPLLAVSHGERFHPIIEPLKTMCSEWEPDVYGT